jgi:malonyl-CoA O-methyltransferase
MDPRLDLRQVRRAFGRAASDYAAIAVLQREVESRLLEQLVYAKAPPTRILDLGCGPGRASAELRLRFPKAELVALDLALPMLRECGRSWRWYTPKSKRFHRVCADARALPFAEQRFDLVFSSLCLQWIEDLPGLLDGLRGLLRPSGLLLFSSFGPDTLFELRESFAAADSAPHISSFAPMAAVGDALMGAGFRDPVLDTDRFTLTYPDAWSLMRELRGIGAGNAWSDRRRSLTGKARMQRVFEAYELHREGAVLPATYEVLYAQAFAPEPGQPRRREGGGEIASFPASGLKIRRKA